MSNREINKLANQHRVSTDRIRAILSAPLKTTARPAVVAKVQPIDSFELNPAPAVKPETKVNVSFTAAGQTQATFAAVELGSAEWACICDGQRLGLVEVHMAY